MLSMSNNDKTFFIDLADRFESLVTNPRIAAKILEWQKSLEEKYGEQLLDLLDEDMYCSSPYVYSLHLSGVGDYLLINGPFGAQLKIGFDDDNKLYFCLYAGEGAKS